MPDANPVPRRNIAVIAVHGVGDQKPFESAHAIGDLLQDLDIGEVMEHAAAAPAPCTPPTSVDPRYQPFTQRGLRINVRPVVVLEDETPAHRTLHGPFNAAVDRLYALGAGGSRPAAPVEARDIATTFMRGQLRCYRGDVPEETYETVRLEGTRTADGGPARTVHVYELYWADLSRLKAGLLSIFTELYQLLFHLPSLGTHAVDAEASQHLTPSWQRFRRAQSAAASVLTVPVPVLNIFMLAVAAIATATALLYKVPPHWQTTIALAVAAAVATGGVGALYWKSRKLSVVKWILPVVVWLAAVIVIAMARLSIPPVVGYVATQVVLILAAALLVRLTLAAYDQRRPGVGRKGWVLGASLMFVGLLASMARPTAAPTDSRILTTWIRVFEVLFASLTVAWAVFVLLTLWAFLAGELAVGGVADPDQRRLARQSRWTARLMLSLPAAAFLSVTLAGWAVLLLMLKPWVGDRTYTPLLPTLSTMAVKTVAQFGDSLLYTAGSVALPVILTAAAIAALPAVWGLFPVVWSEVRPPSLHRARNRAYSERLGRWLTLTFGGLTLSGALLLCAMTFIIPALSLVSVAVRLGLWANVPLSTGLLRAVQATGAATGFLFAWLFAIRGDLKKLALGFAPVLDILLDVDNWLREHPLSRNPKARICGRYVSLLRYLCQWSDPISGRGYDAIVVIAHSQGTVITADLLRFLAIDRDPQLGRLEGPGRIPIYLFTMGCPLRQLYGRRFPRLYAWAAHDDGAAMATWQINDLAVPPRTSVAPDPAALRLDGWVNAYRSGDYIGRHLWRTDPCEYLWAPDFSGSRPANSIDGGRRLEFCIGAGAHTHYWDDTARPIAWALDELIARA